MQHKFGEWNFFWDPQNLKKNYGGGDWKKELWLIFEHLDMLQPGGGGKHFWEDKKKSRFASRKKVFSWKSKEGHYCFVVVHELFLGAAMILCLFDTT